MRRASYRSSITLPASIREAKLYHKGKDSSKAWSERIVQLNIETGLMILYASKGGVRLQKDRISLKGSEFSIVDESIADRKFCMLLNLIDGSTEVIAADNNEDLQKWKEWITGYLSENTQKNDEKETVEEIKNDFNSNTYTMNTLFNQMNDDEQQQQQQQQEQKLLQEQEQEQEKQVLQEQQQLLQDLQQQHVLQELQQQQQQQQQHQQNEVTEEKLPIEVSFDKEENLLDKAFNQNDISPLGMNPLSNPLREENLNVKPLEQDDNSIVSLGLNPLRNPSIDTFSNPLNSQSYDSNITELGQNSPRTPNLESVSVDKSEASVSAISSQKKTRASISVRRSSSIVSEGVRQSLLEIGYKDTSSSLYIWNTRYINLDLNTGIMKIYAEKNNDLEREEDIKGRNTKTIANSGKNFVMGIYTSNENESDAILVACPNKDSFRDWSIWIKTCTSMKNPTQDSQIITVRRKSVATEKAPASSSKTPLSASKSSSISVKRSSVIIAKIDSIEFKVTQIKTPLINLTRRLHLWYELHTDSRPESKIESLALSSDEGMVAVSLALHGMEAPEWVDVMDILRVFEKSNENVISEEKAQELIYFVAVNIPSINVSVNLEITSKESVNAIARKLLKSIPSEYYVNEEDLRKKVTIALTKESNNLSQQAADIILEDLRSIQDLLFTQEDTIDVLRDEISTIDNYGLEVEAKLRNKDNEKLALAAENEMLRAKIQDCEEKMVIIAQSAQEHVDELQAQIDSLGGLNVVELQTQLTSSLQREENLNAKIVKLNVSTSQRVEELSTQIQNFQQLIDTRYEEVKRSESARIILEDELVRVDMVTDKLKLELERANAMISELQSENQLLKSQQNKNAQQPENNNSNIQLEKKKNEPSLSKGYISPVLHSQSSDSVDHIHQYHHVTGTHDVLHNESVLSPKSKSPRKINKEDKNKTSTFLSPTSSHKAKMKDSVVSAQILDSTTTPLRVAGVWK